jgi:LmbE family N-acetylglucosaminyl deacetylase
VFVSPHLDDAVFACGQWIASSPSPIVVTIFAGAPPAGVRLTPWDAECGFREGDDVIAARRAEDRTALGVLGASPVWLDFRDDQYGEPRTTQAIADALACVIEREQAFAIHFPLGLFHRDHRRIGGAVEERLQALRARGLALAPLTRSFAVDAVARKREAVACYRSQLRALATRDAHDDVDAPEAHWRVRRASRR